MLRFYERNSFWQNVNNGAKVPSSAKINKPPNFRKKKGFAPTSRVEKRPFSRGRRVSKRKQTDRAEVRRHSNRSEHLSSINLMHDEMK